MRLVNLLDAAFLPVDVADAPCPSCRIFSHWTAREVPKLKTAAYFVVLRMLSVASNKNLGIIWPNGKDI